MTSTNEISKRLLTIKEMSNKYKELNENNHENPYFYKIIGNDQVLYFIGARHAFDPNDRQFPKIYKYWDDFLEESRGRKCLALVEGGARPVSKDETEAIYNGGEAHLLAFLADKKHIECYSPEPDDLDELLELETMFTREEIIYTRFARTANQWGHLVEPKPDFEGYINRFLARDTALTNWEVDISLKSLEKYHDLQHDHKFSIEKCLSDHCFYNDSSPHRNKVTEKASVIRNVHIASKIIEEWNSGKSIFIVYGSGHAIVLEKALKELLSDKIRS